MRPNARFWIVALFLTACGSAGVRPDEMSAQAHRQEAAYERHIAAERERQAAQEVQHPLVGDPYQRSQVTLDPAARLRGEAESRRAHALEHEAAAHELERFEARECSGIDVRTRAACPVLGPLAAVRDILGGVRIELAAGSNLTATLALMRCHLAYAQSRGFEALASACPLYMRGIEIRASADGQALEVVGRTERLAREIRHRTHSVSGGG